MYTKTDVCTIPEFTWAQWPEGIQVNQNHNSISMFNPNIRTQIDIAKL